MKKYMYVLVAAAVMATAACSREEAEPGTAEPAPAEETEAPVLLDGPCVAGQVVVQFDDDLLALIEGDLASGAVETRSSALNDVLADLGVTSFERVFPDAGEYEPLARREGLHRFYVVHFDSDQPVTKAAGDLEELPGIVKAHPSFVIQRRAIFNDPNFSKQWHYINKSYPETGDINVEKVWTDYTTGSDKVIVAVVDEPVDPTHPDLQANLWKDASGHTGYNFARKSYDLSIRPENGNGDVGHGTHVAGTVAAVNNNGIGVAGVAGGNAAEGIAGVRLMSCAIMSGTKGASDAQVAQAFEWSANNGALISQNSWGLYADGIQSGYPDGKVTASELAYFRSLSIDDFPELKAGIDYFIKYAGCDSKGNQKEDSPMKGGLVLFAAGNEGDLGVDWDPYASYEPIIAVGSFRETGRNSSFSQYGNWIDIAAPGGEGSTSSNSVWSTLPTNITSSGYDGSGWAGTSMACPHASGVAALIISYFGGQGFTADDARQILEKGAGDMIYYNNNASRPIGLKLDALGAFQWAIANGYAGGGTVSPLPPVIEPEADQLTVHAHESATVTMKITDPNGDKVEVAFNGGSAAATLAGSGSTWTMTLVGRNAEPGSYTAVITVTDNSDAHLSTEARISYTILPNHAPVLAKDVNGFLFDSSDDAAMTLDLTTLFVDEDGEEPTVSLALSGDKVVYATANGGVLKVTPYANGFASITLTATDALGLTATATIPVVVRKPGAILIQAYPTSVTDVMYVTVDAGYVSAEIRVYSANGALAYSTTVAGASYMVAIPLDLSGLAPGRYVLKVNYEGKSVSRNFIKR